MQFQNDTISTQSILATTTNNPSSILPDELIREILLRVPVRSLLQFKCVCKSWKTLISDPQFAKAHLLTSTAYPRLVSSFISSTTQDCKINSYPVVQLLENRPILVEPISFTMTHQYHILGSCNGLLCLYDTDLCCAVLWNPSFPIKSKNSPTIFESDNMYLTYHGFGYDQLNDKYKLLVVLRNEDDDREIVTKIYTFGEQSFKTIQNFPCSPNYRLGKHVSGTLNWVVKANVNSNKGLVLSFDLENETYREMFLPQYEGDDIYVAMLEVLNNFLCVCFVNKTHWGVWLMKEYGVVESWTRLMIIPHLSHLPSFVDPMFNSENGIVMVKTIHSKLSLYNVRIDVSDCLLICSKLGREIHICHESLVSPQC